MVRVRVERDGGVGIEPRCEAIGCLEDAVPPPPRGRVEAYLERKLGMTYAEFLQRRAFEEPEPCEACNRPVVESYDGRTGNRLVCDARCRREIELRKRRERRVGEGDDARLCPGCGEYFEPGRSDQRHCSTRCRVRACRKRKAVNNEAQA